MRLLTVLALLLSASPAWADLTIAELNELAAKLEGMSTGDEPPCPPVSANAPTQLILFEGANAYCPRFGYVHLTYGPDGTNLATKFAATRQTYENRPQMAKIRALIGEENDAKNCTLIRNIVDLESKLSPSARDRIQTIYYSKKGDAEAAECAIASQRPNRALRVIGYSQGGFAMREFAKILDEKKVPIEDALTIDPVGRKMLWVSGVLFTFDNPYFKVTPNVGRWRNFFEKFDRKSIVDEPYFKLGARGSRVEGAEINQEIFVTDYKTDWEIQHPHISINVTRPVQSAVLDLYR